MFIVEFGIFICLYIRNNYIMYIIVFKRMGCKKRVNLISRIIKNKKIIEKIVSFIYDVDDDYKYIDFLKVYFIIIVVI